jgi:hypothetical protein
MKFGKSDPLSARTSNLPIGALGRLDDDRVSLPRHRWKDFSNSVASPKFSLMKMAKAPATDRRCGRTGNTSKLGPSLTPKTTQQQCEMINNG